MVPDFPGIYSQAKFFHTVNKSRYGSGNNGIGSVVTENGEIKTDEKIIEGTPEEVEAKVEALEEDIKIEVNKN